MAGETSNPPKPSTTETIKFLCSYGGRILPRYPDGKLRYYGGQTRVLAINHPVCFSELMVKLGELCGKMVSVRCQLPTEDLDALVCITSDEDLFNLIEEYDRTAGVHSSSFKIRAFLSTPKKCSPSLTSNVSTASVSGRSGSGSGSGSSTGTPKASSPSASYSAVRYPIAITNPPYNKTGWKLRCYANRNPNRVCVVTNGNHWQ